MKSLILALTLYLTLPSTTWAGFTVVNDHIYVDTESGISTFTVEFNKTPDFFTLDFANRQANSFQYYIYGDESLGYPGNFSSIIRGGEIHASVDTLRIREATPSSGDEGSGGWGIVIAEVPWLLNNRTLSFSVNTSLLSSFLNEDGVFKYDLLTTEYGGSNSFIQGKYASISPTSPVPLPVPALLFITGLMTLWAKGLTWRSTSLPSVAGGCAKMRRNAG